MTILIFFLNIINVHGQEIMDKGLIKYYVNYSSSFKNIVQTYQDSSYNMFGCSEVNILNITERLSYDSTKYYEIRPMTLLRPNDLVWFKSFNAVILKVDSINIFIREDVLKELPFIDSIIDVGEKEVVLKYNSFETCLQYYGASDYLRFVFLLDGQYKIKSYQYYMPIEGEKKFVLDKIKYFSFLLHNKKY